MKRLGIVGKLRKLCKSLGTSLTKVSEVTGVPLSSLTQLHDNDPGNLRIGEAYKIRKCLKISGEELERLAGCNWEPTAQQIEYLYTDMRTRRPKKS